MLLCKKIKIKVNDQDAEALEFMQAKCRGLYNWWVMKLRNGERWNLERAKKSLRASKQYDPELRYVYGKLLAEVYFRLNKAMQAFFKRLAEGEKKPGFPESSLGTSSLRYVIPPCTWKYKGTDDHPTHRRRWQLGAQTLPEHRGAPHRGPP